MADPSQNIHRDLLPHVHLLSTFRYAIRPKVEVQDVVQWLLQAPKIARDTAPFYWTYIDAPQDGSIYLAWQPVQRRQHDFSSDGYVWNSQETYYAQPVDGGLVLEMYHQRAGYRVGEQYTLHARRRFRLLPNQTAGSPMQPQIDPALWIIQYGPAERQDMVPVKSLPLSAHNQRIMNFRNHLFQFGQITRKEFMLSDRVNWPTLHIPNGGRPMYTQPSMPMGVPQTMAYPPHGGPSRVRKAGLSQAPPHAMGPIALESVVDDEEDVRGDVFDNLTAREVAMTRYQTSHEWMEEVLSSPYPLGQIQPPDLGLGRKGQLASLTKGIFEAQGGDALQKIPENPYTGQLDPELAKEFRKRIADECDSVNKEIAELKAQHEKTIADFRVNVIMKRAEAELRESVEEEGRDFWRLEGRLSEEEDDANLGNKQHHRSVDEIVASIEELIDKKILRLQSVHRVEAGGWQESSTEPERVSRPLEGQQQAQQPSELAMSRQPSHAGSQQSGMLIGDSDIDMGGTAAGLLDQFSNRSTPINSFATPQLGSASTAGTPINAPAPSPLPAGTQQALAAPQTRDAVSEDINMEEVGDVDNNIDNKAATSAPDQGTGSGDWVVVPKEGVSPNSGSTPQPTSLGSFAAATLVLDQAQASLSQSPSAAPTPGTAGLSFDAGGDGHEFDPLGDLDTAGEALAGYDESSGDMADLNMDLDDSAFGDAFHGLNTSSGANTPGAGI